MTIGHDMTPSIDPSRQKSTGPVGRKQPVYVDLLPPCNDGLPGRREYPGLAAIWRRPAIFAPPGRRWSETIRCPACTAGSAITLAKRAATASDLDERGQHSRGGAFLGDLAAEQNWPMPVDARRPASAC